MRARALAALAALMFCAPLVFGDVITLVDKRILHAKVTEEADEHGVVLERLDNGGRIFVRWSLISESDRSRLRRHFGLEEDDSDADVSVDGHRIVLRSGDFHDGLVAERGQTHVTFKTVRGAIPYPNEVVVEIQDRAVSVFDVYTSEELYAQRLEQLAPGDTDIEGHFEMARWATRVTMYAKAIEHYDRVKQIDVEYKADYIANQLKLLDVLDKQKEIRDAIKLAAREGNSKNFTQCFAIFDEVLAAPELSKEVRKEVEDQKARFTKLRETHFAKVVVDAYYAEARRRIDALARDKNIFSTDEKTVMTLDRATTFLRGQLHKDIVEAIATKHGLDAKAEVEKWWKERPRRSTNTASYGSGTFIISGDKDVGQDGGGGDQMTRNVERLLRAARGGNQQQPQQAQRAPLETKDQWWRKVDSAQRTFFLRAWFAENAGQLNVVRTYDRPCDSCGGAGTLKETGNQGAIVRVTCPRCHGNKGDRVVEYR